MVKEAQAERDLFRAALQNPALEGRTLHNNVMWQDSSQGPSILAVNAAVLDGELEYRKQFLAKKAGKPYDFEIAFDHLRKGVQLDLGLKYDEPWGQMQPVRHILGALLFEQSEYQEAEEVYRADIKLWKDNMWGLLGLKLCLEKKLESGRCKDKTAVKKELTKISDLFEIKSARCDTKPAKTCFCAQNSLAQPSCCRAKDDSTENQKATSNAGGKLEQAKQPRRRGLFGHRK